VSSEPITYSVEGPVALIGINRPEKRNAISQAMLREIRACVIKAGEEADVGLIYSHNESFSAGLDLRELVETLEQAAPPPRKRYRKVSHEVMDAIGRGPIPFVSAISGVCIGLGLELAAATHIRVADETAYFGLPESQRGMFVGAGGSVNIQRLIGYSRMCDMMLTGRLMKAIDAERIGLVHYLTKPGEHLEKAKSVAAQIATNAPMSSWAVTNLLPRIGYLPHNDALFMEELTNANVRGAGSVERLRAFLDKRTPRLVPTEKKDQ
jgi:enoyl-CoA hydratase/carnithine racemase